MRALLIIILTIASLPILGKEADSLLFKSAQWKTKELYKGVVWRHHHFTDSSLFHSNQYISILEVDLSINRAEIAPVMQLTETSKIASDLCVVAAINGSFFSFGKGIDSVNYNSVDYIRKDFKPIAINTYKEIGKRAMHQKGAVAILNNNLYILKADELADWEKYIYASDVITSGPLLMVDGKAETMLNSSFYTTRHPRTALIKCKDGKIILITVDGRSIQSAGVTLEELTKIALWLNASEAINLDGGGSTTMYIRGESQNGVVNHPSDNKKFDNFGERKVANAIIIY